MRPTPSATLVPTQLVTRNSSRSRQIMDIVKCHIDTNGIHHAFRLRLALEAATGLLLLLTGTDNVGFVFLLTTNHLTRSRAATESSIDECPFMPSPCWMRLLRYSLILS